MPPDAIMGPVSSTGTPATTALNCAGVVFALHEFDPAALPRAGSYGQAVAARLGVEPGRLFKTLVAEVDGRALLAVVPVDRSLDLKRLAAAAGGKRARMAAPATAERLTGYVTGGISPVGQRRRLDAYVDATLEAHGTVLVSAGRRGLQVELDPRELARLLGARSVEGLAAVTA